MRKIAIIAAVAKNRAIGNKNELIYWLPDDLKRFKQLTTNNIIIMGSNTFRSLPKGALPNRRNIVLSRKGGAFPGAETYTSLGQALKNCKGEKPIYIIGGEQLYKSAMHIANELHLTEINNSPETADAFFPKWGRKKWKRTNKEEHYKDEKHPFDFSFTTYTKRSKNNSFKKYNHKKNTSL